MQGQPVPTGLHADLCAALPRWVQEVFSQHAQVHDKGTDGLDLVTSLDLAMQARLEHELPQLLPGSSVIGEEEFRPYTGGDPLWLVDPLDGTVNFVAGVPIYSVAVVLIIENTPFLSIVHDIAHSDTYSAQKGQGAMLNGAPLVPRSHKARLAIVSSGLLKDLAEHAPEALSQLLTEFKLRNFGSQALHLCYAAAGTVSLVASREAKGWDDMAGALIAREAGLNYASYGIDPDPAPMDQDQRSLCAAPEIFQTYKAVFARSCP